MTRGSLGDMLSLVGQAFLWCNSALNKQHTHSAQGKGLYTDRQMGENREKTAERK